MEEDNIPQDYRYPSELEGDELQRNRINAVWRDLHFRDDNVDFKGAEKLMDLTSTNTDIDGIPARNRIRRICEDLGSVVQGNMPRADLSPEKAPDPDMSPEELEIFTTLLNQHRDTANRMVRTVQALNQYDDLLNLAIYDAIVDGVGYVFEWAERMGSVRKTPELIQIINKPLALWTMSDVREYERLSSQVVLQRVDPKEVVWRSGVPNVHDEQMTRVTRVQEVDTQWARNRWENSEIQPGSGDYSLQPVENSRRSGRGRERNGYRSTRTEADLAITGIATTWQIEDFVERRSDTFFMSAGLSAAEASFSFEVVNSIMVRTVITGDLLLEKKVYDAEEVPMALPFTPFYVKISKHHPYGFSVPLMLELAQMFANRMRALMIQQAQKSVSPQAVVGLLSALGAGDRKEIERITREGGFGWFEGTGIDDMKKVIQPLQYASSSVNPAYAQVIADEEAAMDKEGQVANLDHLARSRSAAGKHAQMSATDRPKGFSVSLLSWSAEDVSEKIYQWEQRLKRTRMVVPLTGSGGSMQSATLNNPVQRPILELDARGRPMRMPEMASPSNPDGLLFRKRTFIENDMSIPMIARAEGRGKWPVDMMAKLSLASAMAEGQILLSKKTVRDVVLDQRTREIDDANAAEDAREMQENAQALALMQQMGLLGDQGNSGGGGNRSSAAPDTGRMIANQAAMAG